MFSDIARIEEIYYCAVYDVSIHKDDGRRIIVGRFISYDEGKQFDLY